MFLRYILAQFFAYGSICKEYQVYIRFAKSLIQKSIQNRDTGISTDRTHELQTMVSAKQSILLVIASFAVNRLTVEMSKMNANKSVIKSNCKQVLDTGNASSYNYSRGNVAQW